MSTEEEFDYQAFMQEDSPELGEVHRGPEAREERRRLAVEKLRRKRQSIGVLEKIQATAAAIRKRLSMEAIEAGIDRVTIQAVARLIVERFDPEQVILFGSHARGQAGVHSDITRRGRPLTGLGPRETLGVTGPAALADAKARTRLAMEKERDDLWTSMP